MKIPSLPHRWRLTPRQAIALQKQMATQVVRTSGDLVICLVAGLDAAFSPDGRYCLAGVVVWDALDKTVRETHTAWRQVRFPYIPGLLSFRETPALLAALRKLKTMPDVLMCDGQGLAHPRRFGLACHLGILCDRPALGCAKSRLIGAYQEPDTPRGSCQPLIDKGETIGTVLRTQHGLKPVFVSIGHRMKLDLAERIVLDCATRYRLPEPTRLADQLVARAKWQFVPPSAQPPGNPPAGW
jgi:deoxyribonuclease V